MRLRLRRCLQMAALLTVTYLLFPMAGQAAERGQELDLEAWGVQQPQALRFGVLSLIREPGSPAWHLRGLTRLMTREPKLPPPQAAVRAQAPTGAQVLVARFDGSDGSELGGRNRLGGNFGAFQHAPASASVQIAPQADGRRALSLQSQREDAGFAGLWIQLLDPRQRIFLDARGFASLSFWVRGHGHYRLKIADRRWFDKDDALSVGALEDFLPQHRLSGDWQQVVVPLSALPPSLNRAELATLVLEALGPGPGQVAMSTLAFNRAGVPPLPLSPLQPTAPQPQTSTPPVLATWIWHTEDWLKELQSTDLAPELRFLQERGITDVYLQLPAAFVRGDSVPSLARLMHILHAAGLRVHALDGDPHYALPEHHAEVLTTVQRVLDYNHTAPESARFDGLQYDIEPYLLPAFYGPQADALKAAFVSLVSDIYRRTHAAGLEFGLALPAWLDQPDEFTGQKSSLLQDLQRQSDYLAIMDYRTQIWGAAGILAGVETELAQARKWHKKLILGLETMPLPDETLYLLRGPAQSTRPDLAQPALLVWPQTPAPQAIAQGHRHWQMRYLAAGEKLTPELETELATEAHFFWPLHAYAEIPASSLSFAGTRPAQLEKLCTQLNHELAANPAFAGLALHHDRSLMRLYQQPPEPPPEPPAS